MSVNEKISKTCKNQRVLKHAKIEIVKKQSKQTIKEYNVITKKC